MRGFWARRRRGRVEDGRRADGGARRAAGLRVRVGGRLSFALNYAALLAAMTSAYVEKRYLRAGPPATGGAG